MKVQVLLSAFLTLRSLSYWVISNQKTIVYRGIFCDRSYRHFFFRGNFRLWLGFVIWCSTAL
ncbi:hypothetical protein [Nostoc sp.]|uniref:hypothetical protein n=1 Tax=Nostoc sp. TaxID=1180 RepID=UPI002FFA263B